MVSTRYVTETWDSSQFQLQKRSIQAGFILWLRPNKEIIDKNGLLLLADARLKQEALNHPAVVIDELEGDPSCVQICVVTSCGDRNITLSRTIRRGDWNSYLPIDPTPSHLPLSEEPLRLDNNASMRKKSYVNTLNSYRVPLVLLKKYDDKKAISSHRLDRQSLEIVRARCGLRSPLLRNQYQHLAAADAMPHLLRPISRPPQSPPPPYEYQELRIQEQFESLPGLPTLRATEYQPLLSTPARRSQVRPAELPSLRRSLWQREHDVEGGQRYSIYESSNTRARSHIFRALIGCITLCASIMLLALLGYGLFLGASLLIRGLMTVMAAIGAEIAALIGYIATFGHIIARPFIAVGRGIGAFGRAMAHYVKAIVHWIRQLKSHV